MKNHKKARLSGYHFGSGLPEGSLRLVMLISLAAGGPDDSAHENHDEAANDEKNHGRSPSGSARRPHPLQDT
jgi:hypothetical protein